MGAIIPGPGMRATQDPLAEPDVNSGDKVRGLMTLKGAQIISPVVEGIAQGDGISNANFSALLNRLDGLQVSNHGAWLYVFNDVTWDRARGDTNGLRVQGTQASDEPELGNPFQIAGSVDNDGTVAAAEGDVRRIRVSPRGILSNVGTTALADGQGAALLMGNLADVNRAVGVSPAALAPDGSNDRLRTLGDVALDGLGQLCATPAVPGAGVVQTITALVAATETTRRTLITPTVGNRVRIITVMASLNGEDDLDFECYFGTGANIDTTPANAIARGRLARSSGNITCTNLVVPEPDGGGSVGAVDAVVSTRVNILVDYTVTVVFREE